MEEDDTWTDVETRVRNGRERGGERGRKEGERGEGAKEGGSKRDKSVGWGSNRTLIKLHCMYECNFGKFDTVSLKLFHMLTGNSISSLQCAVAVEGRPGSTQPALTHQTITKK